MINVGIDIGSRTIKLIVMKDNEIINQEVKQNSFNNKQITEELLYGIPFDQLTATGYGRHIFDNKPNCYIISEIKAFALGVHHSFPQCRTILDIGGQDTKAISLDAKGKMKKFVMNDKCAAGTGRFLEIMANVLNYSLEDFGIIATQTNSSEKINNMCTVFAESEVISLLSNGADRTHVAHGIHESIVLRAVSQLQKVGFEDNIVFVGGVAYNPAVKKILQKVCKVQIITPDNPQVIGALGCALHSQKLAVA